MIGLTWMKNKNKKHRPKPPEVRRKMTENPRVEKSVGKARKHR